MVSTEVGKSSHSPIGCFLEEIKEAQTSADFLNQKFKSKFFRQAPHMFFLSGDTKRIKEN